MREREQYIEINKRIFNMRDGALLEMQQEYGAKYKKSLGVPMFALKEIGKDYTRNNELARMFWEHGGREQLIMASILSDAETISREYLEEQFSQMNTPELWEQLTLNLLRFLPEADTYIATWLDSAEQNFQILAILLQGYVSVGFNKDRLHKILSLPIQSGGYLEKCLLRVLLKIGISDEKYYYMLKENTLVNSKLPVLVGELDSFYQ